MDLYTLDENFLKKDVIEGFSSVTWTERFYAPGDVNLVVPATSDMINKLNENTFLSLTGSKEVMLLETRSIEDNKIALPGKSLLNFLNERMLFSDFYAADAVYVHVDMTAGETIGQLVTHMAISAVQLDLIGGASNEIPNLGTINDTSGPSVEASFPFGPLLDGITPFAIEHDLGMKLYLNSADASDYSLKFQTYKGVDRTSDQSVNPVVRFSPAMDSLTDVEELSSITGFKSVGYFFPATGYVASAGGATFPQIVNSPSGIPPGSGFDRRILVAQISEITEEFMTGRTGPEIELAAQQFGRNIMANNNYTKMVDGEVVPQPELQYGVDYGLGDIVELQGYSGTIQKARITEYIRSQDATGERAYPTVAIID